MNTESIKSLIKSKIPGSDVEAFAEEKVLRLIVICEALNERDAQKRILSALSGDGVLDDFHVVQFHWYPNPLEWKSKQIRDVVGAVLKPLARNSPECSVDIGVNIAGSTLTISVSSLYFPSRADDAHERIRAVSHEILGLAGVDRLSIHLGNGRPSYPQHGPCEDDDDYDEGNPNWPSKTGNPSGGGRGNNPPRR